MLKNATRNEEGKVSSLMERVTLPVPNQVQVERPSQDQPKEQSQGQRNVQGQEEKPIKGQVECESQEQTKNQSQRDRETQRSNQGQVEFQSQGQTKSQGEGERSSQDQTECQSQGQTKCQSQGPTGREKRSNQDQVQCESQLQTKNQSQHDGDRSGQVDFQSQGQTKCESQGQAERPGLPRQQSLGKTKFQGQSSSEVQAESKSNAIDTKTQPNACVSPSDNPTQLVLAAPNLLPGNIIYYNLKNQPLALKDCNVNSIQFVKLVGVPSKETTSRQPETPPLMKKNDELSVGGCGRETSTATSTTTHNTRMPVRKISGLVLPFNNWGKSILPVSKSSRDKSENFMEASTREATLQQAIPKVTTPGL